MTNEQLDEHLAAISKDVAVALLGEPNPKLSKGDKLRWGNKGSRSLDASEGLWYDFEAGTGGDALELVAIQCQTDRRGAMQWLRDNGFLPESPNRRTVGHFKRRSARPTRQADRQRAAHKPKSEPKESGTQNFARKLWRESEEIGEGVEHPFRRWTTSGDKPGVLHPYCAVPGGIRWHSGRGLIVCGGFSLNAWGTDGIPKGDPLAVQAMALDQNGENRYCLGENKDLRRCSYGPVTAGVFILGGPTSERVNIVEGVADALAVYSREPGAVLATLGTSAKIANKADVINWLCTRETWLYPDNDENKASEKGTAAIGLDARVRQNQSDTMKAFERLNADGVIDFQKEGRGQYQKNFLFAPNQWVEAHAEVLEKKQGEQDAENNTTADVLHPLKSYMYHSQCCFVRFGFLYP